MGVGHVIAAAAAAAAPSLRNYIQTHRRTLSDDSDGTIIPSRPLYITPEPSASHPRDPEDLLVDEMARKPLLVDTQSHSRQSSGYSYHGPAPASYGTITNESTSAVRTSPERYRRDSWLDRVPEEAAPDEELENEDEWDLEEQGYYRGESRRMFFVRNSHCHQIADCAREYMRRRGLPANGLRRELLFSICAPWS